MLEDKEQRKKNVTHCHRKINFSTWILKNVQRVIFQNHLEPVLKVATLFYLWRRLLSAMDVWLWTCEGQYPKTQFSSRSYPRVLRARATRPPRRSPAGSARAAEASFPTAAAAAARGTSSPLTSPCTDSRNLLQGNTGWWWFLLMEVKTSWKYIGFFRILYPKGERYRYFPRWWFFVDTITRRAKINIEGKQRNVVRVLILMGDHFIFPFVWSSYYSWASFSYKH